MQYSIFVLSYENYDSQKNQRIPVPLITLASYVNSHPEFKHALQCSESTFKTKDEAISWYKQFKTDSKETIQGYNNRQFRICNIGSQLPSTIYIIESYEVVID